MSVNLKTLSTIYFLLMLALTDISITQAQQTVNAEMPLSFREELRQNGIDIDVSLTQFYQGLAKGDGDKHWQYGGKTDVRVKLDLEKMLGLWPGFSVSIHHEYVYGNNANAQGDGTLLPVNTALAFPTLGGMTMMYPLYLPSS